LADFDELTPRDLAQHLIEVAERQLTDNDPQTQFWTALQADTAALPLPMLEDFVRAVYARREDPTAIIDNLWQLGLLRDKAILDRGQNVTERLERNRELIEDMGQLSEQSRRRIGTVLAKAKGEEADRLRRAFAAILDFYSRGQLETLGRLELVTVEQLLEAGRPLPASARPEPSPVDPELVEPAGVAELPQPYLDEFETAPGLVGRSRANISSRPLPTVREQRPGG